MDCSFKDFFNTKENETWSSAQQLTFVVGFETTLQLVLICIIELRLLFYNCNSKWIHCRNFCILHFLVYMYVQYLFLYTFKSSQLCQLLTNEVYFQKSWESKTQFCSYKPFVSIYLAPFVSNVTGRLSNIKSFVIEPKLGAFHLLRAGVWTGHCTFWLHTNPEITTC